MSNRTKYAFLDRDGTLIFEPPDTKQIDSLDRLRILDGVVQGLQLLTGKGYRLVMVSNQDGLGTDRFPLAAFEEPHNELIKSLRREGIEFEAELICPHNKENGCSCRKPATGMVKELLAGSDVDYDLSFVCGDRDVDRLFAQNLGVRFVPIETNGKFGDVIRKFVGEVENAYKE